MRIITASTSLLGVVFLAAALMSGDALAHHGVEDDVLLDGLAHHDVSDDELMDGVVQDEDDDDLDDILGGDTEESVKDEQEALKSGDIDDRVGVKDEQIVDEQYRQQRRVIKTIQRKNFLKINRFEAMPMIAFVTNDPFLNRYIAGGRIGYHVTEIFAVEAELAYAPDLGEADWKPLTKQLVNENHVSPDISKLLLVSNLTFQFSPIYGKVALRGSNIINFDVYGCFGMGITRTQDDLNALQAENDPIALQTQTQIHPTTNFGGGARVVFNEFVAVRVDGRSLVYIETVNSTTLEMKNNFILSGGVSFFFPGMQ